MYKILYRLPNGKNFAFVSRSGSSSIGLLALNFFNRPEKVLYNNVYDFDSPLIAPHRNWQAEIVDILPPETLVVVRNPIDRFKSLLNRTRIPAENALAILYWFLGLGNKPKNTKREWLDHISGDALYHFRPVSTIAQKDSILVPFEKLSLVPNLLQIDAQLPHVNKNINISTLTEEQYQNVISAYSQDLIITQEKI